MASLADRIKKNAKTTTRGPGGVLTEQSPEEIQKLSNQAGLQAPPTTPLGQSLLGANADQQKMAGTPQQKQAALTLSSEPTSLADTLRRQQSRTQATQDEQTKMQKSQQLQGLGGVGDRVQQFIQAQKQQLAGSAQPLQVQANTEFQGKDLSQISDQLTALRQDPNNLQALAQVNEYLGRDPNTLLGIDEINQLYNTSTQAISQGGAQQLQDNLKVSDLVSQGNLGYDTNQLSELLGVPADQIANMSIPDLSKLIDDTTQREFTQSQQTQAQAVSPLAGGAERQAAQQASREQSTTGITATEADFARLEDKIANADTVSFGGQQMSIEQALSDENISQAITDYMNAAPGSEARTQFEQSEPELVKFIQDNQAVFDAATKGLGQAATELKSINEANKGLTNFGGAQLNDQVAARLIPGYGKVSFQKIDRTQVPVLRMLDSLPQSTQATVVAELNEVGQTLGDKYVDQLVNLDPNQLAALGVTTNSAQWNITKQNLSKLEDLYTKGSQLPPDQYQKYVVDNLAGGQQNLDKFQRNMQIMDALGEPAPGDMGLASWVLTNNGKARPPNEMVNVLRDTSSSQGLANVATSGTFDINRIAAGVNTPPKGRLTDVLLPAINAGSVDADTASRLRRTVGDNLDAMRDAKTKIQRVPGNINTDAVSNEIKDLAKRETFNNPIVKTRLAALDTGFNKYGTMVDENDLAGLATARRQAQEAMDVIRAWYPEALDTPEVQAFQNKASELMKPKPKFRQDKSYYRNTGATA